MKAHTQQPAVWDYSARLTTVYGNDKWKQMFGAEVAVLRKASVLTAQKAMATADQAKKAAGDHIAISMGLNKGMSMGMG